MPSGSKGFHQSAVKLLLVGQVRDLASGTSLFTVPPRLSTCRSSVNHFQCLGFSDSIPSEASYRLRTKSSSGNLFRIFGRAPRSSFSCCLGARSRSNLILEPNQASSRSSPMMSSMAACSSLPVINAKNLNCSFITKMQQRNLVTSAGVTCSFHSLGCCRRVTGSLKDRRPNGDNMLYKYFWSTASGSNSHLNPCVDPGVKDILASCVPPHSSSAAADASLDGSRTEEELDNSSVSSDRGILGERKLKLLSGSCYLPHPAKEETGGEDAHFICVDEQAIGVADGVGGWAELGVDAGEYARELMSHSVDAIEQEPKGSVDPSRVLEKAYVCTKSRGSSTACIVALTDQGIHAINLGDSGFIVVRDGSTVFRSPVQQHDFNFTYQLECGRESDLPSSGQVFTFPVAPGDIVVAGTDGLFDNIYNDEIGTVVVDAVRAGLEPQETARKIAALARERALDKNRQTPFSTAAQDAGYRYFGGKLDDITVVVSYITASDN